MIRTRANATTSTRTDAERLTLLLVDDDLPVLAMLERKLGVDYRVIALETSEQALDVLRREEVAILLVDQVLTTSRMQGDALLAAAQEVSPGSVGILFSGGAEADDVVRAINAGHIYAYVRKPWSDAELQSTLSRAARTWQLARDNRRLVRELAELNAQLEERIRAATAELETKNERLEELTASLEEKNRLLGELAVTDELTGLYNRRYARVRLEDELRRHERYAPALACILLDIDDFKAVNDTYGHGVGDRVLVAVSDVIRNTVRRTDVAARYGGEELLVVCPSTGLEGAVVLAERLRVGIAEVIVDAGEGRTVRVTTSAGVATTANVHADADGFLAAADTALYEAKHAGKDRVVVARPR
ncbi:MAG: hypothetical protein AMXMBFR64_12270 [Myxococcales bacterium]